MGVYCKVVNGTVVNSIVAEPEFFDTFVDSSPGTWIEAFKDANGEPEKRYNYVGVGGEYDATADAFIMPCDYASWTLNTNTYKYEPPVAYPSDGTPYKWNEETQSWDDIS